MKPAIPSICNCITSSPVHKKLQSALPDCEIRKFHSFPDDITGIWFRENGKSHPEDVPDAFRKLTGGKRACLLFVIFSGKPSPETIQKWLGAGVAGCLVTGQLEPGILPFWLAERLSFLEARATSGFAAKRNNDHIRQQQVFLKQIIDLNPNIIFVKDQESRFVLANKAQADAYQTTVDDLIGKTDASYCTSRDEAAFYLKKDREVLKKKHPVFIPEQTYTHPKTGKTVWYEVVKVPMTDAHGQTFILGVAVDITTRKKHENQLKRARKHAEHADLLKSQFLANMSHEIRTPLNTILGFTELLREQSSDPVTLEYLEFIDNSGHNLLSLINDILDLSKIEAGRMELQYSPFSIRRFLKEIEKIFKANCQKKGLAFSIIIDDDVPDILELDEKKLRQILFNLTGNAVKFTDKGSVEIHVSASRVEKKPDQDPPSHTKTELTIAVKDTGIGIPKKIQPAIFNKFQQYSGKDDRKYPGTGLGLAISKRLTEMMNGVISAESSHGKGSTFTLIFSNVTAGIENPDTEQQTAGFVQTPADTVWIGLIGYGTADYNRIKKLLKSEGLRFWRANNPDDAIEKITATQTDWVIVNSSHPVSYYRIMHQTLEEYDINLIGFTIEKRETDPSWDEPSDGMITMLSADKLNPAKEQLRKIIFDRPARKEQSINSTPHTDKLRIAINEKLTPQWKKLGNALVINDISRFSDDLIKVGEEFEVRPFRKFGRKLKRETNRMDIDRIKILLEQFQELADSVIRTRENNNNND